MADTLEGLRPKRKIYNSLEEAQAALQELQKEYQAQIGKPLHGKDTVCQYSCHALIWY